MLILSIHNNRFTTIPNPLIKGADTMTPGKKIITLLTVLIVSYCLIFFCFSVMESEPSVAHYIEGIVVDQYTDTKYIVWTYGDYWMIHSDHVLVKDEMIILEADEHYIPLQAVDVESYDWSQLNVEV